MVYSSDPVQLALQELLSRAAARDERDIAAGWALAATLPELPDGLTIAQHFENTPLAVDRTTADLLHFFARSIKAQRIVEFGSSFGVSTLALAAAAAENGGSLVSTEIIESKARATRALLQRVGLLEVAEVRAGDALQTLHADHPIDLLFLDGHKPLYLPLLQQLEPALTEGALLLADDTELLEDQAKPFLRYLHSSPAYLSVNLPTVDGLTVALYSPQE